MVAGVDQILGILTIIAQICLVVLVTCGGVIKFWPTARQNLVLKKIIHFCSYHAIILALIVATTATLGSLFYSEVAKFTPCELCWWQRILMYPQVVILAISLWYKDRAAVRYCLGLSIIGAMIAGYHYLLQLGLTSGLSCSAIGYSVSCVQNFVLQFGYITIPLMSLTAFLEIIALMILAKLINYKKTN